MARTVAWRWALVFAASLVVPHLVAAGTAAGIEVASVQRPTGPWEVSGGPDPDAPAVIHLSGPQGQVSLDIHPLASAGVRYGIGGVPYSGAALDEIVKELDRLDAMLAVPGVRAMFVRAGPSGALRPGCGIAAAAVYVVAPWDSHAGGIDWVALVLRAGLSVYVRARGDAPEPFHSRYLAAEAEAMRSRRGLWSDPVLVGRTTSLRMPTKGQAFAAAVGTGEPPAPGQWTSTVKELSARGWAGPGAIVDDGAVDACRAIVRTTAGDRALVGLLCRVVRVPGPASLETSWQNGTYEQDFALATGAIDLFRGITQTHPYIMWKGKETRSTAPYPTFACDGMVLLRSDLGDPVDLPAQLLAAGFATYIPHVDLADDLARIYIGAEASAWQSGKGRWSVRGAP